MKKILSASILAASLIAFGTGAQAETQLRLGHIWPASSSIHTDLFEAWAESVNQASGGELKVNIYPSQTLVKANHAYEGAVQGIVDISAVIQGYTAGRFPLSEIAQLPGITTSARQGACILQSLYDNGQIADEYKDTQVLFMFSTGPAYLHTRERDIQTPDDLKGLRMRRPNEVAGTLLESMGASPVGLPAPEIYQAMERGVVDGLSFPFEAMKVFRINELSKYHLKVPYTSSIFVATMSKATYNRLSPEMQAVINDHSGMKWALKAGDIFNRLDEEGLQEAISQGDTIRVVEDPLSDPVWAQPLKAGSNTYLKRLEERGLTTAQSVYDTALSLRDQCTTR